MTPQAPTNHNFLKQPSNSSEHTLVPEKKRLSPNQKKIISIASGIVIAITVGGFTGCSAVNHPSSERPVAEAPADPSQNNEVDLVESTDEIVIPAKAAGFYEAFQPKYGADTLSVYYAELEYKKKNPYGALMSPEYIDSYEFSNDMPSMESILCFKTYELAIDAPKTIDTSIKVFNEYTAPMLELYLNHRARNNSGKAGDIVDTEFIKYCSTMPNTKIVSGDYKADDDEMVNLVNIAKSVVDKYGPTANYTVAKATTYNKDLDRTSFNNPGDNYLPIKIDDVTVDHIVSGEVRLVILIDQFNGEESTRFIETIKGLDLSLIRQKRINGGTESNPTKTTTVSIGVRGN